MTIQTSILSARLLSTPQLRSRAGSLLAALVASSLLAACGGGGSASMPMGSGEGGGAGEADEPSSVVGKPSGSGAAGKSGEAGAGSVNCDDRPTESVTLNQPIWQTGFKVTLGTAVLKPATPSCSPGLLTIDAEFENRGSETESFDARTLLSSAGKDYELPSYTQDLPEVPGGRMGKGSFSAAVDELFNLNDATLLFGGANRHQAKVPFGRDSPDELVTLEPQSLPLEAKVVAGSVTFTFEGASVLADAPGRYESLPADAVYLKLNFSAMATKDLFDGAYISRDAFVLELPDGTSIAPEYAAGGEIIYDKGETLKDMWVGFMVPSPAAGEYTVEARDRTVGGSTRAKAALPLVLPSFPTFGDK